ncbi:MAG: hypothetical protein NVSMB2_18980 [Chloroflexota bacterium]
MAAFRTLWTAFVGLYEDSLPLLGGNLAALVANLPIGIALFAVALPFASPNADPGSGAEIATPIPWLIAITALAVLILPTPGNLALAYLSSVAVGPDVAHLSQFRGALERFWVLGLRCTAVSLVVLVALVWNIGFYLSLGADWVRFVSVLWLYATLFWLGLHLYVPALAVYVSEPRVFDLYRRAAFICLGHLGYSMLLLVAVLSVAIVSVAFLPLYLLVGGALVSLCQAQALREVRRRHGDLLAEADEEVSRL